jgi:hypothetical protein
MEILLKMLNVFAWIAAIACPVIMCLKLWLQFDYAGSLEEKMDAMKGQRSDYTGGVVWLLIVSVVSIVYLIVK